MALKTYQTPEALFRGEPVLVQALTSSGLGQDYLLQKVSSKKAPYSAIHLRELLGIINKELLEKLATSGKNAEYESDKSRVMSLDNPAFLIDTLTEFGRTAQIEAFDMLLLIS